MTESNSPTPPDGFNKGSSNSTKGRELTHQLYRDDSNIRWVNTENSSDSEDDTPVIQGSPEKRAMPSTAAHSTIHGGEKSPVSPSAYTGNSTK